MALLNGHRLQKLPHLNVLFCFYSIRQNSGRVRRMPLSMSHLWRSLLAVRQQEKSPLPQSTSLASLLYLSLFLLMRMVREIHRWGLSMHGRYNWAPQPKPFNSPVKSRKGLQVRGSRTEASAKGQKGSVPLRRGPVTPERWDSCGSGRAPCLCEHFITHFPLRWARTHILTYTAASSFLSVMVPFLLPFTFRCACIPH